MPNATFNKNFLVPNTTLYSLKREGGSNRWITNVPQLHDGKSVITSAPTLEQVAENLGKITANQDKKSHIVRSPQLTITQDGYLAVENSGEVMVLTFTALNQLMKPLAPTSGRQTLAWLEALNQNGGKEFLKLVNSLLRTTAWKNRVIRSARTLIKGTPTRIAYGITSKKDYHVFDGEDMCEALVGLGDLQVQSLTLTRTDFDIRITQPMDSELSKQEMLHVPVHGFNGRTNFVTEGSTFVYLLIQKLICTNGMRSSVVDGMVSCTHKTPSDVVIDRIGALKGKQDVDLMDAYINATKVNVPWDHAETLVEHSMMQNKAPRNTINAVLKNLDAPSNFPRPTVARIADAVTLTAHENYTSTSQFLLEDMGRNFIEEFKTQDVVESRVAELVQTK